MEYNNNFTITDNEVPIVWEKIIHSYNCQWGFNDEQVRKAVRIHTANRVFVCDSQIHYEKKRIENNMGMPILYDKKKYNRILFWHRG